LPALADDDEFYHADLVGLKVVDPAGDVLGHIVGLFNHGAGDMLEIRLTMPAPTDFLPFTKEFVPKIDIKAGYVEVVLPKDFGKPAAPPPKRSKGARSRQNLWENAKPRSLTLHEFSCQRADHYAGYVSGSAWRLLVGNGAARGLVAV